MNLLYICSHVMEIQTKILNALSNIGIDVKLLSYSTNKKYEDNLHYDNEIHYSGNSHCRGPFFYITKLKKAYKFFENQNLINNQTILHGNMTFCDGYICRMLSIKNKVPYVLSFRNTDLHLWFLWKLPWIRSVGYKNLLEAKSIIFLTNSYKKRLINRIPSRIKSSIESKCVVVPNGVDDYWLNNVFFEKRILGKVIKFITIGRIEKNKNQLLVAQAIEKYASITGRPVEYSIIGDCCDTKYFNRLMKYNFISYKKSMPKEELINELRNADLFIMVSHAETFGLVYAEAMSQGLPVIYSKGEGFDEQFKEGLIGYHADSNNIDDIFDAICLTVKNYDTLSKNATLLVEKFRWKSIALEIKNIYQEKQNAE